LSNGIFRERLLSQRVAGLFQGAFLSCRTVEQHAGAADKRRCGEHKDAKMYFCVPSALPPMVDVTMDGMRAKDVSTTHGSNRILVRPAT
jgi:hypothetical protein